MFLYILLLVLNFAISWFNSVSVGKMWSESKVIGGAFRVYTVAGYVMAVTGFTMVYGYSLLLLAPYIIPLIPALAEFPVDTLISLADDLLYVMIAICIIPTGFIIWYQTFIHFWRKKTLKNGLTAAWNTFAQIRNTISVVKNMPSAIGRIKNAFFGKKGKKGNGVIIFFAVLVLVFAVLGGWLTASAIMKRADKKHDGFAEFSPENQKSDGVKS